MTANEMIVVARLTDHYEASGVENPSENAEHDLRKFKREAPELWRRMYDSELSDREIGDWMYKFFRRWQASGVSFKNFAANATRSEKLRGAPGARETKMASTDTKIEKLIVVVEHDDQSNPEDILSGDPDYEEEERERIEAYNRGEWHFVGIYVSCNLWVLGTLQTVRTPGLWGIDSESADSKKDVMETAGEEYGLLKDILKELNVDTRGMPPLSMAQIQWR